MDKKLLRQTDGSALLTAAVAAGVLSILVAGFISYMANEYLLNFRSHAWTQALHLAESGVETGFAEFNYQYYKCACGFYPTRGWSGGNGTYTKTVTVTNDLNQVVGTAVVTVNGVGSGSPWIESVGAANTSRGPATIARAVRVIISTSSRFPVGLMSKRQIDLNGNNMYSDSFNSSDPTKSTNGRYDSTKKQPNGDVASDDTVINTVDIGNADIYGKVYTGSGGTVDMGPNGSVGNTFVGADRATTVSAGESMGYIRHDFSVDVPDVTLPAGATAWWSMGSIGSSSTTINGNDYLVSSISLSGNKTLTIQGNVRLYVTGDTSISGNAAIIISSNATLTVYSGGNVSIAGNGVQNNAGYASKCQWNGLPPGNSVSGCTSVSISGNGNWIGTIYAPQADMTVSGNGSLYGAAVAKTLTLGGNANFHYDESLKTTGGASGYVVSSWQELHNSNGSWVP